MSRNTVGPAPQHDFSRVPAPQIQRSVFGRPYNHKTTMNSQDLVPLFWDEALPGDTYHIHAALFGRLATLKFPMMDTLYVDLFWFFVPERLLWIADGPNAGSWEKFQGFQPTPTSSTDFLTPRLTGDVSNVFTVTVGDLGDYFGLPLGAIDGSVYHVRSAPFRAYAKIWNDWFRDENYQAEVICPTNDGPDTYEEVSIVRPRGKRHDYFTSALPSPQKGPSVPIPWGNDGIAPVYGDGNALGLNWGGSNVGMVAVPNAGNPAYFTGAVDALGDPVGTVSATGTTVASRFAAGVVGEEFASSSGLVANIGLIAASLNELRQSAVLQQIFELDARGGTRYPESVWNRFRTVLPDYRSQRPEYIGGSSTKLSVTNVPNTTPSNGAAVQAALASYAQAGLSHRVVYSAVEHGIVMCLANIRAPLTYQQRLDRSWTRKTRFDFYEPLTAHLGEQTVLQSEIYFPPLTPEYVWGYQERWAEYRYKPSIVTGKFRSAASGSLDAYHLALKFDAPPEFDSNFIPDDPQIDRVVALSDQPEFLVDFLVDIRHARPMPVYGIPGLTRF